MGSKYDGGVENSLKLIVFLFKFINMLIKVGLIAGIWIFSLRSDKDLNRSQYNDSSVNANLNN